MATAPATAKKVKVKLTPDQIAEKKLREKRQRVERGAIKRARAFNRISLARKVVYDHANPDAQHDEIVYFFDHLLLDDELEAEVLAKQGKRAPARRPDQPKLNSKPLGLQSIAISDVYALLLDLKGTEESPHSTPDEVRIAQMAIHRLRQQFGYNLKRYEALEVHKVRYNEEIEAYQGLKQQLLATEEEYKSIRLRGADGEPGLSVQEIVASAEFDAFLIETGVKRFNSEVGPESEFENAEAMRLQIFDDYRAGIEQGPVLHDLMQEVEKAGEAGLIKQFGRDGLARRERAAAADPAVRIKLDADIRDAGLPSIKAKLGAQKFDDLQRGAEGSADSKAKFAQKVEDAGLEELKKAMGELAFAARYNMALNDPEALTALKSEIDVAGKAALIKQYGNSEYSQNATDPAIMMSLKWEGEQALAKDMGERSLTLLKQSIQGNPTLIADYGQRVWDAAAPSMGGQARLQQRHAEAVDTDAQNCFDQTMRELAIEKLGGGEACVQAFIADQQRQNKETQAEFRGQMEQVKTKAMADRYARTREIDRYRKLAGKSPDPILPPPPVVRADPDKVAVANTLRKRLLNPMLSGPIR